MEPQAAVVYRVLPTERRLVFCMPPGAVGELQLTRALSSTVAESLRDASELHPVPVVLRGPVTWDAESGGFSCDSVLRVDVDSAAWRAHAAAHARGDEPALLRA